MSGTADVLGISDDRLLHMRGVAERAYELAGELFGWPEEKRREMFVMGFLHDVGYRFVEQQTEHEECGGRILGSSGYGYWREIQHHGAPDSTFWSDELLILNMADMETGPNGDHVTMVERLRDIGDRYGDESEQYTRAEQLITLIQESAPINRWPQD